MNNFFIMLFHTYWNKLKTKSFIITTLLTVVLIIGFSNIPKIIELFAGDGSPDKIAVLDETGSLLTSLQEQLIAMGNEDIELEAFSGTAEEAAEEVESGDYAGFLELTLTDGGMPAGSYHSVSMADTGIASELESSLQQVKAAMASSQLNLTQEQLATIYGPVEFQRAAIADNAKTEEEMHQARGLVYVILFFIYITVIMYANMIATEVAQEKSSRVMEILISSVSPIKQMFAKILGVGLLAFTQLAVFLLAGFIAIKQSAASGGLEMLDAFGLNDIPAATIVYAISFFVLGYFLYATLAAFLGSLVSRTEDVAQVVSPLIYVVMIGFFIAIFGLNDPESMFVTITSYIPFFAPMIMFLRVGMLNIPVWEVALSISILAATIMVLAVFGAKVYRGGVLMYGKSNSFKDIKKALQLTKKS